MPSTIWQLDKSIRQNITEEKYIFFIIKKKRQNEFPTAFSNIKSCAFILQKHKVKLLYPNLSR